MSPGAVVAVPEPCRPSPEIGVFAALLNQRIADVVSWLQLYGRRNGREYIALNPTRTDRSLGSFRIVLEGANRGRWKDFATGDGGDALDLICYCRNWSKSEAWKRAVRWLELDSGELRARVAPAPKVKPDTGRKRQWALKAWQEGCPAPGTLTDLWLHERGIRSAIHPNICHHKSLPYWHDGRPLGRWPAMLVRMDDAAGRFAGIHRTYLEGAITPNGVEKAPVPNPRKVLGDLGVVWLGRRDAEAVVVGEGVETVLAASELQREVLPVWGSCREPAGGDHTHRVEPPEPYGLTPVACICATGLETFVPPSSVRRLFICEDADAAGRRATGELAKRALAHGIRTVILHVRCGDGS